MNCARTYHREQEFMESPVTTGVHVRTLSSAHRPRGTKVLQLFGKPGGITKRL